MAVSSPPCYTCRHTRSEPTATTHRGRTINLAQAITLASEKWLQKIKIIKWNLRQAWSLITSGKILITKLYWYRRNSTMYLYLAPGKKTLGYTNYLLTRNCPLDYPTYHKFFRDIALWPQLLCWTRNITYNQPISFLAPWEALKQSSIS